MAMEAVIEVVAPCMSGQQGATIKMHKLTHIVACIQRLGDPKHYNANHYEASHKEIKQAYSRSSKKRGSCIKEVVDLLVTRDMCKRYDLVDLGTSGRQLATCYQRAHSTTSHQLARPRRTLTLSQLQSQHSIESIGLGQHEDLQFAYQAVQVWAKSSNLQPFPDDSQVGYTHNMSLPSKPLWLPEGAPLPMESLRAHPHFHNKGPWFDSVMVYGDPTEQDPHHFAQLVCLFSLTARTGNQGTAADTYQLCLVRWYDRVPRGDAALVGDILHHSHGCTRLRRNIFKKANQYQVLQINSIKASAYVQLDVVQQGCPPNTQDFHFNPFKWDQSTVGLHADTSDCDILPPLRFQGTRTGGPGRAQEGGAAASFAACLDAPGVQALEEVDDSDQCSLYSFDGDSEVGSEGEDHSQAVDAEMAEWLRWQREDLTPEQHTTGSESEEDLDDDMSIPD